MSSSNKARAKAATIPAAVELLLHVHLRNQQEVPHALMQRLRLDKGGKQRAYPTYEYAANEAAVITAAQLEALPKGVSSCVAAALWAADFKWRDVFEDGGVGTYVFFGYSDMYGAQKHDVADLEHFHLRGSRLHWRDDNGQAYRARLTHIEVPLRPDSYILVARS